MGKILLFYKYVDIEHPKRILKWQYKICQDLKLTGRILIGKEGINGTVGGTNENTERYKQIMSENTLFADVEFKQSNGNAECFPKLLIKIRDEIVTLGVPSDKLTPKTGGIHLNADQTHQLISENPNDLVILDTRNDYEWEVGKFENAITTPIKNFKELPEYIDNNLEQFKNKQVLMYCTGGVRCERATAYLNEKYVAKQVYQIEGGIHKYTEKYPNGYFRGKNYVFDGRIALKINDDVLGKCYVCKTSCDEYTNCINVLCNRHFICCIQCLDTLQNTCSLECKTLVSEKKVKTRDKLQKVSACQL